MVILVALLMAFLIYKTENILYEYFCYRNMEVFIRFTDTTLNVGDKGEIQEIIVNDKKMALPIFELKFKTSKALEFRDIANSTISDYYYRHDIFSIKGKQKITRSMNFTAAKRGVYRVDEFDLITKDYFFTKTFYFKGVNDASIMIYPEKINVKELVEYYRRNMGEQIAKRLTEEDPLVFRGIREYAYGDSMKRVNWKSTASSGKLLVNTYESTNAESICLILDINQETVFDGDEVVEGAASIVSSLSQEFLSNAIPVSLFSNAAIYNDYIHILADSTSTQLTEIDSALAKAQFGKAFMSLDETIKEAVNVNGESTIYMVVSVSKRDKLSDLLSQKKDEGINIFGIIPYNNREAKNLLSVNTGEGVFIDESFDEVIYPWSIV